MNKKMFLIAGLLSLFPVFCHADDFLGAPLVPEAQVTSKTDRQIVLKTNLSHDQVVAFYKDALKAADKDTKYREWKEVTYIEDDGSLAWHSITVSKEQQAGTPITVTITKDNWTWIVGTLTLRFVGVFVVLALLWLGMSISGAIMGRLLSKSEAKGAAR
ncbi:MAG: hypothetical protein HZB55_00485 [Deltaproteobacteria bacterium]|nr:hypothetical protein [Deltaproteobacteria bacterium]